MYLFWIMMKRKLIWLAVWLSNPIQRWCSRTASSIGTEQAGSLLAVRQSHPAQWGYLDLHKQNHSFTTPLQTCSFAELQWQSSFSFGSHGSWSSLKLVLFSGVDIRTNPAAQHFAILLQDWVTSSCFFTWRCEATYIFMRLIQRLQFYTSLHL